MISVGAKSGNKRGNRYSIEKNSYNSDTIPGKFSNYNPYCEQGIYDEYCPILSSEERSEYFFKSGSNQRGRVPQKDKYTQKK
jgi:hypothetical protein